MTEVSAQQASTERWQCLLGQGVDPQWLPYLDAAIEAQYEFNGLGKDDGEGYQVAWNIGAVLTAIGPKLLADHRDAIADAIERMEQGQFDEGRLLQRSGRRGEPSAQLEHQVRGVEWGGKP